MDLCCLGISETDIASPRRGLPQGGSHILCNYSSGSSWYMFGPANRLQYDIAGTLGSGAWGYIVGTYDKDAGSNNQRLNLNGTRVAQMSDTQPLAPNANPLGIGRHGHCHVNAAPKSV